MPKLLLVEDDKIIANIYQRKFTQEGFTLAHAEDGRDALVKLTAFEPDVVVLDIMLPKLSGLDVLRELRANPEFTELPVIVFSNAYQSKLIEEAWAAGATNVLMKASTNPKTLLDNVNELLAKRRQSATVQPSPPPDTPAPAPDNRESAAAFLSKFDQFVDGFSALHQTLLSTTDPTQRQTSLTQLGQACRNLANGATAASFPPLTHLGNAAQALYEEFRDKPGTISASSIRTSTQVESVLKLAASQARKLSAIPTNPPLALVVDDSELSSRNDAFALERAGCKVIAVASGEQALTEANRNRFDLFVISLDLVGMGSQEILRQLRAIPGHPKTPAVFVTPQPDFQHRMPSSPDANTDVIATPYSLVEMGLKAVVHNLRSHLQPDPE